MTLQVWKFIMDREVEAPERFRAIQTYRATVAVLKQQAAFVHSMYNSGVIDDLEAAELLRCIPYNATSCHASTRSIAIRSS